MKNKKNENEYVKVGEYYQFDTGLISPFAKNISGKLLNIDSEFYMIETMTDGKQKIAVSKDKIVIIRHIPIKSIIEGGI